MKKVFCIIGVMDTGSATLTYPEDFEFVGFYEDEKEANAECDRMNEENGIVTFGEWAGDKAGEEDEEEDEEDFDECTEEMVYTVEEFTNLGKVKRPKAKKSSKRR